MSSSISGPPPPRAARARSVVRMLTTAGPTFSTSSVKSGSALRAAPAPARGGADSAAPSASASDASATRQRRRDDRLEEELDV